eukprot:TRINITY_DN2030_c0_g3_i1.p2 TRINITY_DN2030_c0_g3~~TRINITY_DN2030_c0_g3_i1.p2  ORF type:complete len:624 (-),score=92.83 TRINITY_DN2030_c0_g3_i1:1520-3184(-)
MMKQNQLEYQQQQQQEQNLLKINQQNVTTDNYLYWDSKIQNYGAYQQQQYNSSDINSGKREDVQTFLDLWSEYDKKNKENKSYQLELNTRKINSTYSDDLNVFVSCGKSDDDDFVKIDHEQRNSLDSESESQQQEMELLDMKQFQEQLKKVDEQQENLEKFVRQESAKKYKGADSGKSIKKLLDGLSEKVNEGEEQIPEAKNEKNLVEKSVDQSFDGGIKGEVKKLRKVVNCYKVWAVILAFSLLWIAYSVVQVHMALNFNKSQMQGLIREQKNVKELVQNMTLDISQSDNMNSAYFEQENDNYKTLAESLQKFHKQLQTMQIVHDLATQQNQNLNAAFFKHVDSAKEEFNKQLENLGQQFQHLQKSVQNIDNKLEKTQIEYDLKMLHEDNDQSKAEDDDKKWENQDIFDEDSYLEIRFSYLTDYPHNKNLFQINFEIIDIPNEHFIIVIDQEQRNYIKQAISNTQQGKISNDVDNNMRPSVFDTWKRTLVNNNMQVKRVTISSLENSIYRAEIWTEKLETGEVQIDDSRVSVATNLALRVNAPIFAAKSLIYA